jgi:hypothetical protein
MRRILGIFGLLVLVASGGLQAQSVPSDYESQLKEYDRGLAEQQIQFDKQMQAYDSQARANRNVMLWVILVGATLIVLNGIAVRRRYRRNRAEMDQHITQGQKQSQQMIELLESIDRKLDRASTASREQKI